MIERFLLRPLRKLAQIPSLSKEEIHAYASSPINKLVSRFHRGRLHEFARFDVSVEALIKDIFACSEEEQALIDHEFQNLIPLVQNYLARASTSDLQLVRLLYFAVRTARPEGVVETGVWHGVSTFFLLSAIAANGSGKLHSVDLPPMDPKTRVVVGAAVPDGLRDRWKLYKGPAKSNLPMALKELPNCQLFVHDGEHTYPNMMFEFHEAWKYLADGGLMIVDDADWNDSPMDFMDEAGCSLWALRRDKGGYVVVMRKSPSKG